MNKKHLSYHSLGSDFFEEISPETFSEPKIRASNVSLSQFLNMDLSFLENKIPAVLRGSDKFENFSPLAMAYAGHQFGHFVPQLGDGRAVLISETSDKNGYIHDIQLKGAGRTKFSRRGDGRSELGPVLREYIVSEAMSGLGIPSTRSLAFYTTGEHVQRQTIAPGGILVRTSRGHVRVGTFEYFLNRGETENIKKLSDFCIERFYIDHISSGDYVLFFKKVSELKLSLVIKWMSVGFIHGVMNTDNTSIFGETIDFGPCAFMDQFEHDKVFSSIDRYGRYAYHNQPMIAVWNLSRFAECLSPILSSDQNDEIQKIISELPVFIKNEWLNVMSKKLGIFTPRESDIELINEFLQFMEAKKLDFTICFRQLPSKLKLEENIYKKISERLSQQDKSIDDAIELMNGVNPARIPRNHQIQKVIDHAYQGDYSVFNHLMEGLKSPFLEDKIYQDLEVPPNHDEIVHETFCGT